MLDFIAQYCHRNDDKINHDMFERKYDKPLHEYIVETCKNLEVLPGLTLTEWWLEKDQTKIRATVNKRNTKDPKIKNNKALERLAQPNRTLYDMLYMRFHLNVKGQEADVLRKVRVLKPIRGGMYIRNGKKVRILNQVVDNSTFVKSNVLNFKTKLYPIKLFTVKTKLKFTDGETASPFCFRLDLLSKVTNPLIYYLAKYGIAGTIRKFNLDEVMAVVDNPIDEDHYLYLKVASDAYIEVHEKAFYNSHEFVPTFVATLYDLIRQDKDVNFRQIYDRDYWMGRLAEIFSKKRSIDKASRVLISFDKILDTGVKNYLNIRKKHKKNTFAVIRWMMVNYGELLKKDSHDLRFKRIRANETMAYYFDKHISKNLYSLLNTNDPPIEKYIRMLNSINEYTLLKGAAGGSKSSSTSLMRYERYQDFDAIELSRFTLKGPTGLNGGKHGISLKYRGITSSMIGRYDINVCSSDPGLTGHLCANVKLSDNGFFETAKESNEPDNYDRVIDTILSKFAEPGYEASRERKVQEQLDRDEDGYYVLKPKLTRERIYYEMNQRPGPRPGMYELRDCYRLMPRMERDAQGYIILQKKKGKRNEAPSDRDAQGYYVLRPVITKEQKYKLKNK